MVHDHNDPFDRHHKGAITLVRVVGEVVLVVVLGAAVVGLGSSDRAAAAAPRASVSLSGASGAKAAEWNTPTSSRASRYQSEASLQLAEHAEAWSWKEAEAKSEA
jgi:hypothetical protein